MQWGNPLSLLEPSPHLLQLPKHCAGNRSRLGRGQGGQSWSCYLVRRLRGISLLFSRMPSTLRPSSIISGHHPELRGECCSFHSQPAMKKTLRSVNQIFSFLSPGGNGEGKALIPPFLDTMGKKSYLYFPLHCSWKEKEKSQCERENRQAWGMEIPLSGLTGVCWNLKWAHWVGSLQCGTPACRESFSWLIQ